MKTRISVSKDRMFKELNCGDSFCRIDIYGMLLIKLDKDRAARLLDGSIYYPGPDEVVTCVNEHEIVRKE